MFTPPVHPQDPKKKIPKRFGWVRVYHDFLSHAKWRVVAAKAGVPVSCVQLVALSLLINASKTRMRGYIGNFNALECAAASDFQPDSVASVFRALEALGWVEDDHIADWLDRNPELEDPTAAERQRNRRARVRARKAAGMGGTLDAIDAEMLERAKAGNPPPPVEAITEFMTVDPENDSTEALVATKRQNEAAARAWLFGTGTHQYGPGSLIVATNLGCTRLSADQSMRRWLKELEHDAITLALIVSRAYHEALTGEAFAGLVAQSIETVVRDRANGPPLPFGPTAIKGGKAG